MNTKRLKIKAHKLKFITYLESLGFTNEEADIEWKGFYENVGLDGLGHPIEDADECLSYYGD